MDSKTDLERVIWHEFGHLCIDIILNLRNDDYTINKIEFEYHKEALGNKWGGKISNFSEKVKDDCDLLNLKNFELYSFQSMNLLSGCFFESQFLKNNCEIESALNDFFKFGGSGESDYVKFRNLNKKLCHKSNFDINDFNLNYLSIVEKFFIEELKKEFDFWENLKDLSKKYLRIINSSINFNENYTYSFNANEIDILINEIKILVEKYNFIQSINSILEFMKSYMDAYTENRQLTSIFLNKC